MAWKGGGGQTRRGDRLIAYVRVSDTTGREESLISPEVQRDQIRRMAAREGFVVVDVVQDLDMSGRSSKDRAIGPIIRRIGAGEADGVGVWKVSRWGRNTLESLANIRDLHAAGGFIASATEDLDNIDTAAGRLSLTMQLAIAQMQSDQIGEVWADIRDYRVANGKPSTGGPRWGYVWDRDADTYTPDPQIASWVLRAFEEYASGIPLTRVVEMLRDAGVTAPSGRAFTTNTLRSTMDAGFPAGLIVQYERDAKGQAVLNIDRNIYHPGAHEAIVSGDLWKRYLRARRDKRAPRTKSPATRVAGLVHCETCGAGMTLTQAGRRKRDGSVYRYFRCNRSARHSTTPERRCSAPAQMRDEAVEAAVLAWLTEHAQGGSVDVNVRLAREVASRQASTDLARLDREISQLQARRSRLADLVLDDTMTRDTYRVKDEQMSEALRDLEKRRDAASVRAEVNALPDHTVFSAITTGWETMDVARVNAALAKVVRRIVVTPKMPGQPPRARVVPVWSDEE